MSSGNAPATRSGYSLRRLLPATTLIRLLISWGVVLLFGLFGSFWLAAPLSPLAAVLCFMVLFGTILYTAFGVVREADHLAEALGEPYGTLILTLAIVGIEVILIGAVMLGPGESATIARDSIFAVMMIILNLVTGLCLLLGGLRHGEQQYNAQGAAAYLSMIVLLTGTALIVPNTLSNSNGTLLAAQAAGLALITALLYSGFLLLQMRGYRRFFVQPHPGAPTVTVLAGPLASRAELRATTRQAEDQHAASIRPDTFTGSAYMARSAILIRCAVLLALILPIVLLAQDMAVLIDLGITRTGAPVAVGGLIIAIIVFTPESLTAIKAALADQMQRAVNLCLGAFVSTVGLTVPVVLLIGLATQQTVIMGLGPLDTVLLVITVLLSTLTFFGLHTSPVQGMMHLALFAIYTLLLFVP